MSTFGNQEIDVMETDPTGRYIRYKDILGEGSCKTVYKGFDKVDGKEIAWSQVQLSQDIQNCPELLKALSDEAKLLKSLKHENIMKCYHSWIDVKTNTINMITELFTSGDLQYYCNKHAALNRRAIKNWARQILKGLNYLHTHNPPIIHRDLKCGNIFVNGNSGRVKLGDLGLAVVLDQPTVKGFHGTPGFIAPEIYEGVYNQLVDIYAFGMCILQMVIREEPYGECFKHCQIMKKIMEGVLPDGLNKVKDSDVRAFIVKCLGPVEVRPSASELLDDPFLADVVTPPISCSLDEVIPLGVNKVQEVPKTRDLESGCGKERVNGDHCRKYKKKQKFSLKKLLVCFIT